MPLNPLIIETDYFSNIQDRSGFMKAADFDFQFNNIASYINSSVAPLLRQLVSGTTPGTQDPNKINTYLKNIGDGTTEWSNITFNEIPDYSLSFSTLVQTNSCSILATGADQIFRAVTPTEDRQSLISQNNSIPIWAKITAANIEDRQITDAKIALASLVDANFQNGILDIQLTNNSVTTAKIANNAIPSIKIANSIINSDILGEAITNQLCGRNGNKVFLWGNTLPNGFINSPALINVGSEFIQGYQVKTDFPIDYTKLAPNFKIPAAWYSSNASASSVSFYAENLDDKSIENYQIIEKSLDGDRLGGDVSGQWQTTLYFARDANELLEDGSITIEKLPPFYRTRLGL